MTEANIPEQLELDLEFPTPTEYTITLAKGVVGDLKVVRTHKAKTDEDALNLIEGLTETYGIRESVTWREQEMPESGAMYGLGKEGVVYEIAVVPQIGTLS